MVAHASSLFLRPVSHCISSRSSHTSNFLCRSIMVRHERQGLLCVFQGTQSIYQSSAIIYYSATPYIKPLINKRNSWTRNTSLSPKRPAMRVEQSAHSQALRGTDGLSLNFRAIEQLGGFCYRMETNSPISHTTLMRVSLHSHNAFSFAITRTPGSICIPHSKMMHVVQGGYH